MCPRTCFPLFCALDFHFAAHANWMCAGCYFQKAFFCVCIPYRELNVTLSWVSKSFSGRLTPHPPIPHSRLSHENIKYFNYNCCWNSSKPGDLQTSSPSRKEESHEREGHNARKQTKAQAANCCRWYVAKNEPRGKPASPVTRDWSGTAYNN